MKVVGFDTATDDTAVAGWNDGQIVFESRSGPGEDGRPAHSGVLLAGASEAAAALGGWDQVDRIAVGLGPGTFTGLRIGIATATGLAVSAGIDLAGVPTLRALALDLAEGGSGDSLSVPVLDAKRGEVFIAVYDSVGREVSAAVAVAPEAAVEMILGLGTALTVGGPGAVRFADLFDRAGVPIAGSGPDSGRLSGSAICELGAAAEPAGPQNPLEPIYIRAPDAQLWLERDAAKLAG